MGKVIPIDRVGMDADQGLRSSSTAGSRVSVWAIKSEEFGVYSVWSRCHSSGYVQEEEAKKPRNFKLLLISFW